jgi:glycosyltransferase involved in cell wall biosynthesis
MGTGTSVIIPVRNGAAYLAEAMASVLVQLDRNDELIVVDDNSTDDTSSVAAAIADPRSRMLRSTGRGVSAARNAGLAAARGAFIAFLDHDDTWPAGRHETTLRMLMERPDLDAVFGRVRVQFEPGIIPTPRFLGLEGAYLQVGLICSGLFRRRGLDRISGFAEDMRFGEDSDYCMRLLEAGIRTELCDVDGLVHRRHGSNATNDTQAIRAGMFDALRRKTARARVVLKNDTHPRMADLQTQMGPASGKKLDMDTGVAGYRGPSHG